MIKRPPLLLAASAVAVAAAALLPVGYLMIRGFERGMADVAGTIADPRTMQLLLATVALTIAVSLTAVTIAVPLAWLTARSDLPGRRAWTILCALPLVVPSYVAGYTFVGALGPRGLLQQLLEPIGVERLPEIYGFPGAWLVLSLFTYPYVFLTARGALAGIDPGIEEAAQTLGQNRLGIAWAVIFPQLRPAVASGALLVALYTLHDFGAVSLLRFNSFTRGIFLSYQGSFDRSRAAVLSLVLTAFTLIVVSLEIKARPRASYHVVHSGAARTFSAAPLGKWRMPIIAGLVILVAITLGLPLAVIGHWLYRGVSSGADLSFTWSFLGHSVQASALGAACALAAAWPISVLAVRFPGRLSGWVERAAYVSYALPGLVVALALVFLGTRVAPALYQTQFMLAFAYMILFIPQATGALKASLAQMNPRLREAAKTLGRSRTAQLQLILIPLLRPGLVAGAALVFLTAMKELPATLLLAPVGFGTLATRIWSSTNSAHFVSASLPALALIAASSVPLGVLLLKERTASRIVKRSL